MAWIRAVAPGAMIVSAVNGITTHFTFMSKRRRAKECPLIDSSTTKNFLDHHMVKWLKIGTRQMPVLRRIFNVDGTENIAGKLTHCCTLHVHKREQCLLQTFYITMLGADCMILSYPWLKVFNLQLDWREERVLGPRIQIETYILEKHNVAVLERIVNAARADLAWEEGDEVIIMAALVHMSQ